MKQSTWFRTSEAYVYIWRYAFLMVHARTEKQEFDDAFEA